MTVLDTNVISEVFKPVPSEEVLEWLAAQVAESVFTTAITEAEIFYGIELMPQGKRRAQFAAAAEKVFAEFAGRILNFDSGAAREFAVIVAARDRIGRPVSEPDAMIAAIARIHLASVATRNTRDFELCEIQLINPWEA